MCRVDGEGVVGSGGIARAVGAFNVWLGIFVVVVLSTRLWTLSNRICDSMKINPFSHIH